MNPFDTPPSGAPITSQAPPAPDGSGPGRGRMVLVAVLTAGLIGGGVAAVSQLVSADEPELSAAPDDPSDETVPPVEDEPETEEPGDSDVSEAGRDGEIVIDLGEGEPIVVDLGDIEGDLQRLSECVGLPTFEVGEFDIGEWEPGELPNIDEFLDGLPFDLEALEGELAAELGDLGAFEHGGSVTVAGPDGVSIVDLGENGSVTVTASDGDITVETDGDATVSELDDLFGEFEGMLDELFADGEFDELLESLPSFEDGDFDELLESMPSIEELPELEQIDPEAVEACLDEVLGR